MSPSNKTTSFTVTRVCGTTGKVLGTSTMPFPTFVKKARSDNKQVAYPCPKCGSVHSDYVNAMDCCKVAKMQAKADALQANIDGLKADRDALAAMIDHHTR